MATCYYCEDQTPNTKAITEQATYWVQSVVLCDSCIEQYNNGENKTGHCSIDCIICGRCDESC